MTEEVLVIAVSTRRRGQFEPQAGAAASVASGMRGQAALMRLDDGAGDGQPQAAVIAEIFTFRTVGVKPFEHLFARIVGNAGTTVDYLQYDLPSLPRDANFDDVARR